MLQTMHAHGAYILVVRYIQGAVPTGAVPWSLTRGHPHTANRTEASCRGQEPSSKEQRYAARPE